MMRRSLKSVTAAAVFALVCHCGAREAPAQESAATLETPSGRLHGTLLVPPGTSAPMPVALIIAGSGPTDRDGNSPLLPGRNNGLKMIADALAAQGVASLRYDKRGIGASGSAMGSESALRFTHYADDAAGWIAQLAADSRFSRVIVVGHSEGSLLGIMAAQRGKVASVISLAGAGKPIMETLDDQLARGLAGSPLQADARRIMAELKAGRTVADVPPPLMAAFRPSVQPYLMSWLPIDPAQELAKLTVPVLVVQGTTDVQISVADAERLVKDSPHATLTIIEGMNHVLKEVRDPARQVPSYSDSTLALHPKLVDAMANWVKRAP